MNKKVMEWWHSHHMPDRPDAKFVLMVFALDADIAGCGKTSRKRLEIDTDLTWGQIIDVLIDLEKRKLVKADISERGAIDYQLNLKKWGKRRK